jgi:hypothetical protein
MTPEQRAREQIAKLLRACGWNVQDYSAFNPAQSVPSRSDLLISLDLTTNCSKHVGQARFTR